jgi:hypothetical protein
MKRIYRDFFFDILDEDYDNTYEECTVELRASLGDQIRLVFYLTNNQIPYDNDKDYIMSIPKSPCLRIIDVCLIDALNSFFLKKIFVYLGSGNHNI